ncbi:MAG TPA: 4-hydroxy-tetrahydrodipicolinate reductase, partial [Chitinophagales bacterium]|nr:4-hydroxy-tetrahydrodipicolinate reductase [Chitinophagales bacterium]
MKIALIGYGKMGKEIEKVLLDQNAGDEIVLKITADTLTDLTVENLKLADVAIEFTQPDAAVDNIKLCLQAGVPVV